MGWTREECFWGLLAASLLSNDISFRARYFRRFMFFPLLDDVYFDRDEEEEMEEEKEEFLLFPFISRL